MRRSNCPFSVLESPDISTSVTCKAREMTGDRGKRCQFVAAGAKAAGINRFSGRDSGDGFWELICKLASVTPT